MPQCSEIGLMLSAAGDGELAPGDLREVAHHVEQCTACTGELSDYSKIGRELRAIAVAPSLEGFTKSVLDVIAKIVAVAVLALALHSGILRYGVAPIARSLPETVASRQTPPAAVRPSEVVDVQVDSAFVADTAYNSFSHTNGRTESGKLIVFKLPDGKTLHVMPRAIEGGMISMQVVSVRRRTAGDDGRDEAWERRHLCAGRREVRRGHAVHSDQPDDDDDRVAHSASVIEADHLPPATEPTSAIATRRADDAHQHDHLRDLRALWSAEFRNRLLDVRRMRP